MTVSATAAAIRGLPLMEVVSVAESRSTKRTKTLSLNALAPDRKMVAHYHTMKLPATIMTTPEILLI